MKNKKKTKEKLQDFIAEEFKTSLPITILPDNSVVYKRYRIKQSKVGYFNLHFKGLNNESIDRFNLKVSALIAAKNHDRCRLDTYNKIKELDRKYWNNFADAKYFQHKRKITKDFEKFEILTSRYDISSKRAVDYRDKITRMFRSTF